MVTPKSAPASADPGRPWPDPGAAADKAIVPLDAKRIVPEGERNPHPVWVSLRDASELDRFYEEPAAFLRDAGNILRPYGILHLIDDAATVYSQAVMLLVRGGHTVIQCEVKELVRVQLRPQLAAQAEGAAVAASGWSFGHMGSHLGWCVLKDGKVRVSNLASEAAARNRVNAEISHDATRR